MQYTLKDSVRRIVFKLRLWGDRLGPTDVSDPNFIVLRCPFNFLCIFKDGAHRSKTEFKLGPSSDVIFNFLVPTQTNLAPHHAIATFHTLWDQ